MGEYGLEMSKEKRKKKKKKTQTECDVIPKLREAVITANML